MMTDRRVTLLDGFPELVFPADMTDEEIAHAVIDDPACASIVAACEARVRATERELTMRDPATGGTIVFPWFGSREPGPDDLDFVLTEYRVTQFVTDGPPYLVLPDHWCEPRRCVSCGDHTGVPLARCTRCFGAMLRAFFHPLARPWARVIH